MSNLLVFVIVVFAGIYAFYVIYKQIKNGKCSSCCEKNSCTYSKTECQESKGKENQNNKKKNNV
ncbi:MAG: FeoB-associated Cys-rich membrane protein [Victivallales bacterium]|nr:FeoB-associated Cys-rich membrane protein [Victivallales bacterium]